MNTQHPDLSHEAINIIVDKAVRNTLTTLGIDISSTKELRHVQADFIYIRQQRIGAEEVGKWTKKACVGAFISGTLYALWVGFSAIAKGHL